MRKQPKSPADRHPYRHSHEPSELTYDLEPTRDLIPANEVIENSLHFRWYDGGTTQVKAGFRTPVRIFPFAAVSYARNASVRFWTENQAEQIIEGEAAVFVPPNLAHQFIAVTAGVSLWAHFTCTVLGVNDVFSLFQTPHVFRGAVAREMGQLCQELARCGAPADTHPLLSACDHVEQGMRLLRLLLRASRPSAYHNLFHDLERLSPVLQHVEEHFAAPVTRESLAALVNLSPNRFCIIFKTVTGHAPMAYVRRLRLKRASELLLGSPLSVSEIAQRVGYSDQFHFSHEFKRIFRLSPLQYRQSNSQSPKLS